MAIAAVVVHAESDSLQALAQRLQAVPCVVGCRPVPPCKLAVTVESSSDALLASLRDIRKMPGILNLELVYVNYEDELDENGSIACPPLAEINRQEYC